jgi:hypothetical protein
MLSLRTALFPEAPMTGGLSQPAQSLQTYATIDTVMRPGVEVGLPHSSHAND